MTAPNPVARVIGARVDESCRLGVMNYGEFTIKCHPLTILFVVGEIDIEVFRPGSVMLAMKRVVKGLGDLEKIVATGHDIPTNGQIKLFREGHQAIQDFRDAAADRSGVDHLNGALVKRLGERAKFGDLRRTE